MKLLGGLRLPRAFGFLARRGRTIALFEAGAASGIAPLLEGRCKIIAAQYLQTNFSAVDAARDDCGGRRAAFPLFEGTTVFALALPSVPVAGLLFVLT